MLKKLKAENGYGHECDDDDTDGDVDSAHDNGDGIDDCVAVHDDDYVRLS